MTACGWFDEKSAQAAFSTLCERVEDARTNRKISVSRCVRLHETLDYAQDLPSAMNAVAGILVGVHALDENEIARLIEVA